MEPCSSADDPLEELSELETLSEEELVWEEKASLLEEADSLASEFKEEVLSV